MRLQLIGSQEVMTQVEHLQEWQVGERADFNFGDPVLVQSQRPPVGQRKVRLYFLYVVEHEVGLRVVPQR